MSLDPEALLREAQSLERQGRLSEAIAVYRQLLTVRADIPDAWYNLAVLLRRTADFPTALACYQHALNRGAAQPEEIHLNRAVIYSDCLRQYAPAERELMAALALNPTFIPALLNLANLQEDQGRAQDAAASYERILGLQPLHAEALARYAGLKSFQSPDDPLIRQLQGVFTASGTSDADRASLGFSLGRALDSCGAYAAAFETYAAANRYSRASASPGEGRYDRAAQERFVDRLIAAFPTPAADTAHAAGMARPAANPRPIFICGMFRSGSTLIEQLIADHTDVTPGGELEFLPNMAQTSLAPFPESMGTLAPGRLESLAARYLRLLGERFPGAACVTDKRPDNFIYIGLIKLLFPAARIVHTRRDPLDNCLSIFFLHLHQRMGYALDLADIGHYYVQYLRVMQHWKTLYPQDIFDVSYDRYVHHPQSEAERLFGFLGLESAVNRDAQPQPAREIKTASVWQVRQPVYSQSSGRARHYASYLAALREYLELYVPPPP